MTHIPRILITAQDKRLCNFLQASLAPYGFLLQFLVPEVPLQHAIAQFSPDILLTDSENVHRFEHYVSMKHHPSRQVLPALLLSNETTEDGMTHEIESLEHFVFPGKAEELAFQVQSLLCATQTGQASSFAQQAYFPRKPMLRGFVHEISNTLTSNMLVLTTAFEEEDTLSLQNTRYLHQLFDRIEPLLSHDDREAVLDYLHRIDQNEETLDRVLRLVNDANERAICHTKLVSEYAKIEYLPMTIQPLLLDREVATVLKQYHEPFESQNITVTLNGICTYPFLGHQPHIRTLFEHLLKNAYDAFIRQPSPSPQIGITFTDADTTQSITIQDNAGGIQPEHLSDVFEPFYTTSPKTHAGLGLCFVAKLVSLYTGSIALDSTPEKGTTVHIDLPLYTASTS
jgi:signal transduction histidine kinase